MAFTASERLDLEDFANNLLNAIMTWTSVKNRTYQSVLASRFLEKSILKISRKQCFLFPLRESIESYECGKKIRKGVAVLALPFVVAVRLQGETS